MSCLLRLIAVVGMLAPLALGPALAPLISALGGEGDHACACGMKPGTCGCPECALLAGAGSAVPDAHASLRSCDDHRVAPPSGLPPGVLPAGFVVAPAPSFGLVASSPPVSVSPGDRAPPPTPPPRRIVA